MIWNKCYKIYKVIYLPAIDLPFTWWVGQKCGAVLLRLLEIIQNIQIRPKPWWMNEGPHPRTFPLLTMAQTQRGPALKPSIVPRILFVNLEYFNSKVDSLAINLLPESITFFWCSVLLFPGILPQELCNHPQYWCSWRARLKRQKGDRDALLSSSSGRKVILKGDQF